MHFNTACVMPLKPGMRAAMMSSSALFARSFSPIVFSPIPDMDRLGERTFNGPAALGHTLVQCVIRNGIKLGPLNQRLRDDAVGVQRCAAPIARLIFLRSP